MQRTRSIRISQPPSPTDSSAHSESFTDEEDSSGTGVHVPSAVGSHDYSDPLDDTWDPIYDDEIEPSESASRPRPSQRYRSESRRPPSRQEPNAQPNSLLLRASVGIRRRYHLPAWIQTSIRAMAVAIPPRQLGHMVGGELQAMPQAPSQGMLRPLLAMLAH
ncbi:hypothetical protein DH86_00001993 [Scytalidium sp. 3C]|nr:hypothetical protein DH86_00001993 [Scytalidium sp. 3C]